MKMQKLQHVSFSFLLLLVVLLGSGGVLRISPGVCASDPAPIDKTEVESIFASKKVSLIIDELDKIGLDKRAVDDHSIISEVVSLYSDIDNMLFSRFERVSLKKKVIRVLYKSRVPLSTETLERISLIDQDLDVRLMAENWYASKSQLPLSMQIDTSKYIVVNGKGMTYEDAYPILVKKIESPTAEQKIDGVKLLGRYGHLLKDKPVIGQLIALYYATPPVPDKPYQKYSKLEKENFILKSRTLLTLALSGSSTVNTLLQEAKTSSNEPMRMAAEKIEALIMTGSMSVSAQSQNIRINEDKAKILYLMLGKAMPKQEALALINKILQGNDGKKIENVIDDIGRAPSLIKDTDAYNTLSKFLVRIALYGVPARWNLSPREIYFLKNQTFINLEHSGDSRIEDTIKKLEKSTDSDIKYLVDKYREQLPKAVDEQ